jgi:CubicO group peptidase (beta-lactamase class C family)
LLSFRDTVVTFTTNLTYSVRSFVTVQGDTKYSPAVTVRQQFGFTDALAQLLTSQFRERNIGYGFTIYKNGQLITSGAGGLKSRSVDPTGTEPYSIDTKMHIASMSKTITAMAFVQLASRKGIRTTDKIRPYLPPSWAVGENIDQITFWQLFNHRSGIVGLGGNCKNGSYDENVYGGLKQLIASGVKQANMRQYCYQNANIGLMRVLIPAILGYQFTGNDATDDQETVSRYIAYVRQQVLEKAGITNALPTYPDNDPTLCYSSPYIPTQQGWNPGSFFSVVGAYGWYLTPREAGQLYARVLSSTDESVLPTAYKDTLLLNGLGNFKAAGGTVAYHDGWWYTTNLSYVGLRTIWMKLPNDITVVLFVNTVRATDGSLPSKSGADIVPFMLSTYYAAQTLSGARVAAPALDIPHPEPH